MFFEFCGLTGSFESPDVVPNAGRQPCFLTVDRLINRTLRRNMLSPHALFSSTYLSRILARRLAPFQALKVPVIDPLLKRSWQRFIENEFAGRYGESNRRTEILTGLPLGELGYDLGQPDGVNVRAEAGETQSVASVGS